MGSLVGAEAASCCSAASPAWTPARSGTAPGHLLSARQKLPLGKVESCLFRRPYGADTVIWKAEKRRGLAPVGHSQTSHLQLCDRARRAEMSVMV